MKSVWDEMEKESFAKGEESGKKEGRQEGENNALKRVVLSMLKAGDVAIDRISAYTGFSVSQVQELAKTLA